MKERNRQADESLISAVDLFCGAGGLTYGLLQAGIQVEAGVDVDEKARYAYEENNPGAEFVAWDVQRKNSPSIERLFTPGKYKLLAGCAPCQPFSKLTQGKDKHKAWSLLNRFGCYVKGILPDVVTMENVPELASRGWEVFEKFLLRLEALNYDYDWEIVNCAEYGVPQLRKRLVLLASRLGPIKIPEGPCPEEDDWCSVRETIGELNPLGSGEEDPDDFLHVASELSPMNLKRIRATPHDGGNRFSWPDELVPDCYKRKTGERYFSIYGRMWWDKPAPTMTTLCTGLGNGRFGHPEQDRSITLREASLFQSFPPDYKFWPEDEKLHRGAVARMIGNALPPKLAEALGHEIVEHVTMYHNSRLKN